VRAETGIRVLNWCEGVGFRQFYSKKPIFTPADMKGMKFRVPENKGLLLMFRGMGAGVVTIPWSELYTAMQTGVAEGAETESSSGLVIKLNEVINYLTISNHAYNIQPLLMNDAFYKKLPEKYQYIIQKAADQSDRAANGYSRVADYGAIQQYLNAGVKVNYLTEDQKNQFKALAQPPYLEWVTEEVGKEWVDKFTKAIEIEKAAWDKEIKEKVSK
jgi:TRAP-type C4-dicarboxylate transport system substrate-binding protein